MKTDLIVAISLPIGSGAMESAIRRVVNLRLKGALIYWLENTAEPCCCLGHFINQDVGRCYKIKLSQHVITRWDKPDL